VKYIAFSNGWRLELPADGVGLVHCTPENGLPESVQSYIVDSGGQQVPLPEDGLSTSLITGMSSCGAQNFVSAVSKQFWIRAGVGSVSTA